ncbi:uncharacterized protein LOC131952959 [Physella acuta]|uniref:uncharacterized protein LOC131952959 n=1 Tax=Physella acuta TaxID=109671 RepID=UPI0027DC528C|nr:uncharacterized protein LOC131952959 [Physella acuta]
MEFKAFIEDETYRFIKDRYLHKGKGRPKGIPKDIVRNNKILVQLSHLREEGHFSWSQVDVWVEEIFPESRLMEGALTRFRNMIDAARSTFSTLEPDLKEDFLNKDIDFNYISKTCDSLGITRSTISNPPDTPLDPPLNICNELIIDLEIFRRSHSHLLNKKFLIRWLHCLTGLNISKLPSAVDSVFKKYTFLNKQAHRNPTALKQFLVSEFSLHLNLTPVSSPTLTNDISISSM